MWTRSRFVSWFDSTETCGPSALPCQSAYRDRTPPLCNSGAFPCSLSSRQNSEAHHSSARFQCLGLLARRRPRLEQPASPYIEPMTLAYVMEGIPFAGYVSPIPRADAHRNATMCSANSWIFSHSKKCMDYGAEPHRRQSLVDERTALSGWEALSDRWRFR